MAVETESETEGAQARKRRLERIGLNLMGKTSARLRKRYLEVEGQEKLAVSSEQSRLPVPFTLAVAEASLLVFTEKLEASMRLLSVQVRELLDRCTDHPSASQEANFVKVLDTIQLGEIRELKQRLGQMDKVSQSLRESLFEVLGDEDDMATLQRVCGSGEVCSEEDWELCFEFFLQKAEEIELTAKRHIQELEDLESLIGLALSRQRLELEQINLWLEIVSLGLAAGAALTGAFGMNLLSGLENRRHGFAIGCGAIALISSGVSFGSRLAIKRRLRRQNTAQLRNMPNWRLDHPAAL